MGRYSSMRRTSSTTTFSITIRVVVVLTAVEYDHPEFFASYAEIRDAFTRFLAGMDVTPSHPHEPPPTLVLNADSPGCLDVRAQLGDWPGTVYTFGIESDDADVRATHLVGRREHPLYLERRSPGTRRC